MNREEPMRRSSAVWILAAAVAVLVAACSSSNKGGLTVSARGAAVTAAGAPVTATTTGIDLGNGIVIQRVRAVVRHVEVEGTTTVGAGTCTDEDGGDPGGDDCENELKFGPFLIDLTGPTLTGVQTQFGVPVPAGTYHDIDVEIGPISTAKAGTDAGLLEMAGLKASLVVDGTVDGKSFEFTSPLRLELKREGDVVVDGTGSADITFDVNVGGWFGGTGAARLDPSSTDPAVLLAIDANIRASLRVVHDEDRDGCDDDHADSGPGCAGDQHGGGGDH